MKREQDCRERENIHTGSRVRVVRKQDQRTGRLTEGTVVKILTGSAFHPHGIKVMLADGTVGRARQLCTGVPGHEQDGPKDPDVGREVRRGLRGCG